MRQAPAPVETKVAAGGTVALVTGMITWLLVTLVPSWHHGLPPMLANYLPYAVSVIAGMLASYMAPHTSRMAETPVPVMPPAETAEPGAEEPDDEKSAT
jgi:hypothetical protein